ncbi:MAG: hypothetical protein CVU56_10485 [Deltaproteobacteria bacterium HGW-Deltaproteobacteria-14]|jgi:DNA-binding NarL/FixJ family response regulator|nr:MAG: hypothetical protein CVU56_10485 [Deltaproteobacteria bacterium HGW-Deltaproteobacteria-14]
MNDRELETLIGRGTTRRVPFDLLMPNRVNAILLVASLYDSFAMREDGDLSESLMARFLNLDMRSAPRIVRVSTAEQALRRLESDTFQLVVTTLRVGDMTLSAFRTAIDAIRPGLPVLVLAYNERDLERLPASFDRLDVDKPFLWLGDVALVMAMIKHTEDRLNVRHDTWLADVQSILLVEDSVRFYSAFLPLLYQELVQQNHRVIADSMNSTQRHLRRRARPKLLLANTYEEAVDLYRRYESNILGVITDVRYPKDGIHSKTAGIDLARLVKEETPDRAVLVMSANEENGDPARATGAHFVNKTAADLMRRVREFVLGDLGFGDFIFRRDDGSWVDQVQDLRGFIAALATIPDESLVYHASHNHFSTWLMARTEIELARSLRPKKVSDFPTVDALRETLIEAIEGCRREKQIGVVADFASDRFDDAAAFVRIGNGSIGGKGRGVAFMHSVLGAPRLRENFPGVRIGVPPTIAVATDSFDQFVAGHGLLELAVGGASDEEVRAACLALPLPDGLLTALRSVIHQVRYPLAVRSSSLLEDAYFQPFAGVYATEMLPNDHPNAEVRLKRLCDAIKRVYASTFSQDARAYMEGTSWRVEEEKMAVLIQQVVGRRHDEYVYPDLAGVARSVDFYPMEGTRPEDGVASMALGLGRTVAEGGRCVRFSPALPQRLYQFGSTKDVLQSAQRSFFALGLREGVGVVPLDLEAAEKHGTLRAVGSTYSHANDRIYPGVGRAGVRLVTMAGVLGGRILPLPEIIAFALNFAHTAMNGPAEIEFAVNLQAGTEAAPHEFAMLQIRPIAMGGAGTTGSVEGAAETLIVQTDKALGHGRLNEISDVVYIPAETFDRARTQDIATEVGQLNAALRRQGRPYLLIGPGRWGSKDRWLGIPVGWSQINGVRCIVETDLPEVPVTPSQGSHFFQNVTSLGIPYFTVNFGGAAGAVDYAWLDAQEAETRTEFVRHVALAGPIEVVVDSRNHRGVIRKPTTHNA